MSIRAILAAAGGGAATAGTIELGCRLARRFAAHVEAFHVRPDARAVFAGTAPIGGPGSAELVESIMQEAAARAVQSRAVFDEIVRQHDVAQRDAAESAAPGPSASWREATGDAARQVARHGRFFDLVVLGRSDRVVREPHTDTIEETVTHCGRPVLLAPSQPPPALGSVVAVAWNGSPQAVRALAASLPFLEQADAVSLLTAGDAAESGSLAAVDYLAWHGVHAKFRSLPPGAGRHVGQFLLDAAQDAGADLLVMGGYGQAPWRELLFGGATRSALAKMPLPLLLMH